MSALYFASGALAVFAMNTYPASTGAGLVCAGISAVAMVAGVVIDSTTRR